MPDPQPMSDEDRAELTAYLDGELDADGQQRVEARLGRDPHARLEADTLRRTWELLDYLPQPEPSPSFTERTLTRVSAAYPAAKVAAAARLPWYLQPAFAYGAWAAAVLLSLAIGYRIPQSARPGAAPLPNLETDAAFAHERRVVEYLPLYLAADNIQYLLALDQQVFDDTPLRDGAGEDSRALTGRVTDSERRARLQQYLAAYHHLSPEVRDRVRQLDHDLHDKERVEDTLTRARLYAVMERYSGWLARLPEADRRRVEAAQAGGERMNVVREVMEQQWLDDLPEEIADQHERVEKWRQQENDCRRIRQKSLHNVEEMALLLPAAQQQRFREVVDKYVADSLRPKLRQQEQRRLDNAARNGQYSYFHTVLVLSKAHGLTPPGPPEQWPRFRKARAIVKEMPG